MRAPSLIVAKSFGEQAVKILSKMKLLNRDLKIFKNHGLHLPLNRQPRQEELKAITLELPEAILREEDFNLKERRPKTILEALDDRLPPHLLGSLPKSMDVIGSLAIIEIAPELEEHKRLIGEAVLQVGRNIRTVLAKAGPVTGENRVRSYEIIAGSGGTETTYKEFGCTYILDPTRVYFSPRLSLERMRIAQQVRNGEIVLDMFAGVGPFSILIAKTRKNAIVHAVDINADAIAYLRRNIGLNNVEDRVFPLLGDVGVLVNRTLRGMMDRAIMNLPDRAHEYVPTACEAIGPRGGIIHYYSFQRGVDAVESAIEELSRKVKEAGREVVEIKASRMVRETAPWMWQTAVDAAVR